MTQDKSYAYLENPIEIQKNILTDFENTLNDNQAVVDSNNAFTFLTETQSRITSEAMSAIESKLQSVYPKRASTMDELFQHVSDYGYVGFYSYPSTTKLSLTLHKQYIIDNAISYPNSNYRVMIIPKDTTFTIGKYTFSLYYPIVIRVSEIVNNISVVYDTEETNPLHSLNSNTLVKREFKYGGLDLISFEFDVYQFSKEIITETINPDHGFRKKYTYNNKFYAIRIFDEDDYGNLTELNYTLSSSVYDPSKPTARLKVLTDESNVEVIIPQIYFTNNLLHKKLRIEIYNTLGELDVSIANVDIKDIKINFAYDSPNTDIQYSSVLKNIPTGVIEPTNPRVTGGSNGLSFQEMKDIIVYHIDDVKVPITNLDLETYFKTKGFKSHKRIDNLTDRTYYGFRKVIGSDNEPIGIINSRLTVEPELLDSTFDTVKTFNDGIITILPTTVYKYSPVVNKLTIMNQTDRTALFENTDIINMLNNDLYLNHPYHIVLDTGKKYPTVASYDLLGCDVFNIVFDQENINLSAQANVINAIISHLGKSSNLPSGDNGYKIRIGIEKSSDLTDIPESDIAIYLTMVTDYGVTVGLKGVWVQDYNGLAVYDFDLKTNYHIDDNNITITNLTTDNGVINDQLIPLSGKMLISAHVKSSYFPGVNDDVIISKNFLEGDNTYIGISLQSLSYTLGTKLTNVIDNSLLVNWSGEEYDRYQADVPALYQNDVYDINPDGSLKYTIDANNNVVLTVLHHAGDPILDSSGNPVILHHAGDIKYSNPGDDLLANINNVLDNSGLNQTDIDNLKVSFQNMINSGFIDSFGNKIVVSNRANTYTIDIFGIDYKHTYQNSEFLLDFSTILNSYFDSILEINENTLERTKSFFRPISTIGTTTFRINNSLTAVIDLSLSFSLKCYVKQAVYVDANLRNAIENEIITIIESNLSNTVISFTDICNSIKNSLSSYVVSLDIVSINDQYDLQTMMNIETEKEPKLDKILVKNSDNTISFVPNVAIQFESLDDE